jgi:hypothetical protein
VPIGQQSLAQMRTDEAGSTGDSNSHLAKSGLQARLIARATYSLIRDESV